MKPRHPREKHWEWWVLIGKDFHLRLQFYEDGAIEIWAGEFPPHVMTFISRFKETRLDRFSEWLDRMFWNPSPPIVAHAMINLIVAKET